MKEKKSPMLKALREHLSKMSEEEKLKLKDELTDKTPEGWLSIEEHLPAMRMGDLLEDGYRKIKVRFKDGKEDISRVSDHNIWYYEAKEAGITHWYNGDIKEEVEDFSKYRKYVGQFVKRFYNKFTEENICKIADYREVKYFREDIPFLVYEFSYSQEVHEYWTDIEDSVIITNEMPIIEDERIANVNDPNYKGYNPFTKTII